MYPKKITGVKSIAHGNRNEGKARRSYAQGHMARCSLSIIVEDRGLIVNGNTPYLGASIDGSVMCEKCGEGIVETKCPYGTDREKWRNMSPIDCTLSPSFCCSVDDGELHLKPSHNYMFQIQGQMAVCEQAWVDFVIWTKKSISVQRILRNERFWSNDIYIYILRCAYCIPVKILKIMYTNNKYCIFTMFAVIVSLNFFISD